MILALVMALALVACGNKNTDDGKKDGDNQGNTPTVITNPDEVQDEMTSSDGKYEVAFVTDVGQLKDKSFNQGTYDGVKLYAANNNLSYKYYQPANGSEATDDDRFAAMKAAVDNGAKVVVCAGYLQEAALRMAAKQFTDVSFVFIDGYPVGEEADVKDSPALKNIAGVAFKEEQCGYLAGYAVVKEGYTKLGFTGGGGGNNPACCRYGYGFVQGADAAAVEMGIADQVVMEYAYGNQFYGDSDITAYMDNWYQTLGVEVVFASGGGIYTSAAEAAAKVGGKLIGVDVDQSANIDTYGEGMCVTSAMKGLAETVKHMLGEVVAGNFANYGGQVETLGLVNGDDPTANYVQLPMETTQWGDGFTQDDYKALVKAMYDGDVTVSNDISAMPATTITVNFAGNIK